MRRGFKRKGITGLKKSNTTFAVCIIFAAVLTAVNAYAAKGASNAILRDCLGYAYAVVAAAALIWLHVTGKRRVGPEPGRFVITSWEYFFLGAAVAAISVTSFIGIFSEYNKELYRLSLVTQGPFLITRMIFSCLGFFSGPLLLAAGAVKSAALKSFSTAFAAIWSFAYLISECTFFIPLPDISVYLPRLFTATFVTLVFCYLTMAGRAGLRQNASGLRSCAGMLVAVSISDVVFWLLYNANVYREMLFSSLLFAVLFGLYFGRLSLTLEPSEVTGDEI